MATVIIPTPLRKFTTNISKVNVIASNINDLVSELSSNFPGLKNHLTDVNGKVAPFINIFVDNKDIRNLEREQTAVGEGSVVWIIPAIAGGTSFPE